VSSTDLRDSVARVIINFYVAQYKLHKIMRLVNIQENNITLFIGLLLVWQFELFFFQMSTKYA